MRFLLSSKSDLGSVIVVSPGGVGLSKKNQRSNKEFFHQQAIIIDAPYSM
jgi:hypothetical protein